MAATLTELTETSVAEFLKTGAPVVEFKNVSIGFDGHEVLTADVPLAR